jgi:galactokinase
VTTAERASRLLARLDDPGSEVFRAPGRVNLIGEHVDYVGGLVLPFASTLETLIAVAPWDRGVVLESLDTGERAEVVLKGVGPGAAPVAPPPRRLPSAAPGPPGTFTAHVSAVIGALIAHDIPVRGVRGLVSSTVPIGAGLSSSASVEAAVALALTAGLAPRPEVLQEAEQAATGVPAGVMDQTAVLLGRRRHALLIDCKTRQVEHIGLPAGLAFLVLDTGTRRELADGRYATRRAEAEEAVRRALGLLGADDVRRVGLDDLWQIRGRMPGRLHRRLHHLVAEVERVRRTSFALEGDDLDYVGELVSASHRSLRDDYEVSSGALDAACAAAEAHDACLGARMVGGGFAGCALAVVRTEGATDTARAIAKQLSAKLPGSRVIRVGAADGAGRVEV